MAAPLRSRHRRGRSARWLIGKRKAVGLVIAFYAIDDEKQRDTALNPVNSIVKPPRA